jgi:hypothetical protein
VDLRRSVNMCVRFVLIFLSQNSFVPDLLLAVLAMVLRDLSHELLVLANCYNTSGALITAHLQDRSCQYGS